MPGSRNSQRKSESPGSRKDDRETSATSTQHQPAQDSPRSSINSRETTKTSLGTSSKKPDRLTTPSSSEGKRIETPGGRPHPHTLLPPIPLPPPPDPDDPSNSLEFSPRPKSQLRLTKLRDGAASRQRRVRTETGDQQPPAYHGARRASRRFRLLTHSLLMFRTRPQPTKPRRPFRVYVRVTIICINLWRQTRRTLQKERGDTLSLRQILSQFCSSMDKSGAFFDLRDYSANTENYVSQEAKRLLQKYPRHRTEEDIDYLMVALRNILSFAEYPKKMQRKVCRVAWYESFEHSRTIVREGDPAGSFYFILTGSVIVTKYDRQYGTSRTLVSLEQGMFFGELAIITRGKRQASVSTQTLVELMCISRSDFEDIFMQGMKMMTDPVHGSFLKSVYFLKDWPVQLLHQNPEDCLFHYFNRGQVLVRDSNNSDWIYIVTSGSLSVMKKLHHADASKEDMTEAERRRKKRMKPKSPEVFKNVSEADRRLEQTLPGIFKVGERLGLIDYDRIISEYHSRVLPRRRTEAQLLTLPHITVEQDVSSHESSSIASTNDQELEEEPLKPEGAEAETAETETTEEEPEMIEEADEEEEAEEENEEDEQMLDAAATKPDKNVKGVYLRVPSSKSPERELTPDSGSEMKTPEISHNPSAKTDTSNNNPLRESVKDRLARLNFDYQRNMCTYVGRKTMADQLDFKGSRDFCYTEVDLKPMFVLAQVLERGQYFGVSQLVYPDQPSLSLVSNGAELVIMSKKLFLDHASEVCLSNLRKNETPYPAQDELQDKLQEFVNWKDHRERVYRRLVTGVRQKDDRRKQHLPRVPPGVYNFRSGTL